YITSKSHKQLCPQTTNEQKGDFQAGWDAAKQRLSEVGYFEPFLGETQEIKTINGQIETIKDNIINLKIRLLEPLSDPELDSRVIEVDENTKIYKSISKDHDKLRQELEEYRKALEKYVTQKEQPNEKGPVSPESFIKQEADLSDIAEGQQITVIAEQDIKDSKQFKASEIIIQSEIIEESEN
ncbi:hypothetical protein KKA89_01445, partial [Patescibacteria group bacterium]|nr:hypothetical protein [Patescibacteria group bacterium]